MINKRICFAGIVIAVLVFMFAGCERSDVHVQRVGGFAIYLVDRSADTAQLAKMDIDSVPLETMPVITVDDIVSYNKETHEIELTSSTYDRLMQMGVPVNGRYFAVCLDGNPVYLGAFWVMWSSLSYDGVVIMLPSLTGTPVVQISLGYPGSGFFTGKDPRNNKKIFKSLELAGKLKQ
jgi:hypothetical protein